MNLLNKISKENFYELISIKFKNITIGLNNFNNGVLEPIDSSLSTLEKEQCFINFFRKALVLNNSLAIVDFYLKDLESTEILYLLNALEEKEKLILLNEVKACDNKSIYFSLNDDDLMDFITILNIKNLFFCTVYFKELPITVWGNYDFKFPIFFNDREILEKYKLIANECGLQISNIIYLK